VVLAWAFCGFGRASSSIHRFSSSKASASGNGTSRSATTFVDRILSWLPTTNDEWLGPFAPLYRHIGLMEKRESFSHIDARLTHTKTRLHRCSPETYVPAWDIIACGT
jgi:hypothetical protein